jgi:hypothetical protein
MVLFNSFVNCEIYIASMVGETKVRMVHWWNDNDRVKPEYSEKNPSQVPVFFTTDLTCTDLESKRCTLREMPASNRPVALI